MTRFLKADKDTRGVKTSTVMFVPSSKAGTLISMLKEREDTMVRMTKFRVKFQEAGGVKLKNMFSTDLAAGANSVTRTRIPEEQNPAVRKPERGSTLGKAPDPFMNGAESIPGMPETSVGVSHQVKH